jgi:DNA mismatch repair ATPase MutS
MNTINVAYSSNRFYQEMKECSYIVETITEGSLIIIDEVLFRFGDNI